MTISIKIYHICHISSYWAKSRFGILYFIEYALIIQGNFLLRDKTLSFSWKEPYSFVAGGNQKIQELNSVCRRGIFNSTDSSITDCSPRQIPQDSCGRNSAEYENQFRSILRRILIQFAIPSPKQNRLLVNTSYPAPCFHLKLAVIYCAG